MNPTFADQVAALERDWADNPRWNGVTRDYGPEDVVRLRGSVMPECTLARQGATKLWDRIHSMEYVHALGAMTGGQAIQYAKAGLLKDITADVAGESLLPISAGIVELTDWAEDEGSEPVKVAAMAGRIASLSRIAAAQNALRQAREAGGGIRIAESS